MGLPITERQASEMSGTDLFYTVVRRADDEYGDPYYVRLASLAAYLSGLGLLPVTGPASATDNAVARFNGTTGERLQNSSVIISDSGAVSGVVSMVMAGALSGVTSLAMGGALTGATTGAFSGAVTMDDLNLYDTNASHTLTLHWDENEAASNRVLNIVMGGADRTVTLGGNPTLSDWFDQSVKAAAIHGLKGLLASVETELTIAAGVITATQMRHKVDTQADDATDNLDTINGGATVNMVVLRPENGARTVVVKHNTGNIWLQGGLDITLDDLEDGILLVWDSTNSMWFDIASSGGGVSGVTAAAVIVDHTLVRGDGGVRGIQDSGWVLGDDDVLHAAGNLDMEDKDVVDLRDIFPHDGTLNVQLPLSGTVYIKGTSSGDTTLDLFEYADDPTAQAAYPSNGYHTINFNADAQLDTAQKKFGPSSLFLDGTGDYLHVSDSADWYYATGNVTIDFWVRLASLAGGLRQIGFVSQYDDDNNLVQMYSQDNSILVLHSVGGGVTKVSVTGPWSPVINTWYHLAYVRNGNNHALYVNGTNIANAGTTDADELPDVAANLDIGRIRVTAAVPRYLNGWMDELRISKGVARWTADFSGSLPTTPHQADTNTSFLAHFDGADAATAAVDDSRLEATSESVIVNQGTYSLQGFAKQTDSLNDTLTRTVAPTVDLSGLDTVKFDIYSSRTGANIKIGIHDSGGTTTEKTHTQAGAGAWETVTWDISGVADADKDDIDSIIVTVVNADADNTFYLDNMFGVSAVTLANLDVQDYIHVSNTGLLLADTDDSHELTVKWNENEVGADRILNLVLGGADRTITLGGNLTVEATSIINSDLSTDANWATSGSMEAGADADVASKFGRAQVGFVVGLADIAAFSHVDQASATTYAFRQDANADTYINTETGQSIFFAVHDVVRVTTNSAVVTLSGGMSLALEEQLRWTGGTAVNTVKFPDNLADALSYENVNGDAFQKFISTTGSLAVEFGQNVGIGVTPAAGRKLDVLTTYTAGDAYGVYSQAITNNANDNIGVYANAVNAGAGNGYPFLDNYGNYSSTDRWEDVSDPARKTLIRDVEINEKGDLYDQLNLFHIKRYRVKADAIIDYEKDEFEKIILGTSEWGEENVPLPIYGNFEDAPERMGLLANDPDLPDWFISPSRKGIAPGRIATFNLLCNQMQKQKIEDLEARIIELESN